MDSAMEEGAVPEIVGLVNVNDEAGVNKAILRGAKVDETDGSGMTALHHAAYKGQADMCTILLKNGADVNNDSHDHRYSPLHFAALSGSVPTVQILLNHGARTHHTNSLGRTAAQMAAFVGNHAVVALVNNYLPMEAVLYYTAPQGLEQEPKLPEPLAKPLYEFIMRVNLHPVRVAMSLEACEVLRSHISQAYKVLDLMCEREAKRQETVNEVLCIKFHYLSYLFKTLEKEMKKHEGDKGEDKDFPLFGSIMKKWLRGREKDGFEEQLEYYLRDAIKSFPYVEMPLFLQLVRNITGQLGDSWALGVLCGCINGQRAFQDDKACGACGEEKKDSRKCSKCKAIQYCDRACQKLHWTNHKKFCARMAEEYERQQKALEEEKKKEEEEKKKQGDSGKIEEAKDELISETNELKIS